MRLNVFHVGGHDREALLGAHPRQAVRATAAGGELGKQVGDVLVDVARGAGAGGEQVADRRLAEPAFVGEENIVQDHALVGDRAAVGRH